MTIEQALLMIFNEYGLLIALLTAMNVVQWRTNKELTKELLSVIKGNTEVITKLLERLEKHD